MRHLSVLGLLVASAPALGAEPVAPVEPCFAVIAAAAQSVPFGPMLVDRCTGTTWLLAKQQAVDASGRALKEFVWRWHPLSSSGAEAVLTSGESRLAGETIRRDDKPENPKTAPAKTPYSDLR